MVVPCALANPRPSALSAASVAVHARVRRNARSASVDPSRTHRYNTSGAARPNAAIRTSSAARIASTSTPTGAGAKATQAKSSSWDKFQKNGCPLMKGFPNSERCTLPPPHFCATSNFRSNEARRPNPPGHDEVSPLRVAKLSSARISLFSPGNSSRRTTSTSTSMAFSAPTGFTLPRQSRCCFPVGSLFSLRTRTLQGPRP